jgi:phosphohistidine phosphatase
LRLILMRHAKSDFHIGLPDHARPLNKRGHRASSALGTWLRNNQYLPDEIISSTATQTPETCNGLKLVTRPLNSRKLYQASQDTMHTATGETVLMLGHKPGICTYANALLASYPINLHFEDYPSVATLIAEFNQTKWPQLIWEMGHPHAFIAPYDSSA